MSNQQEARLHSEVQQITDAIQSLTGLRSQWSGNVSILPTDSYAIGRKSFDCLIQLRTDLLTRNLRWRTLIHEAFHAVSAGYYAQDFFQNVGWEEGVVENLQRLFRRRILAQCGIILEETLFFEAERNHSFNRYIDALESIRTAFGLREEEFYLMLIRIPIRERYTSLTRRALQMGENKSRCLFALSAAQIILKEGNRGYN